MSATCCVRCGAKLGPWRAFLWAMIRVAVMDLLPWRVYDAVTVTVAGRGFHGHDQWGTDAVEAGAGPGHGLG